MQTRPPVDLSNCASEPIHIPGAIQAHGALLAFDREQRLVAHSANAEALVGQPLALGLALDALPIAAIAREWPQAIWQAEDAATVPDRHFHVIERGNAALDVIAHGWKGHVIVELEPRDAGIVSTLGAGRAYQMLRSAVTVDALLARAVEALRSMTGYDRVMAYRFHPDESGEVVAEARDAALDPFLGMRYPASDIPPQARRLYLLNTVRGVVSVRSQPVPLLQRGGDAPLDLSFADLRAVSPIHVEYLSNMGVGGSMSLSLIVDGSLYGLFACHHRGARLLSADLRVACEGFAHTVSSRLQALVTDERARRRTHATAVQAALVSALDEPDDLAGALARHLAAVGETLRADAMVACTGATVVQAGDVAPSAAREIARLVRAAGVDGRIERDALADWPPAAAAVLAPYAGVLARRFDHKTDGWLIALRREEVATISWAGDPHKPVEIGPNGPRLTPRGSFELWTETVRGRAPPWLPIGESLLGELAHELERAMLRLRAQLDQVRAHVLAMLGHDLRNPLQAISSAAFLMERQQPGAASPLAGQIRSSSTRMSRLIGQSLDFTRLTNGLALSMKKREVNVAALTRDIVREFVTAYPEAQVEISGPAVRMALVDPDRYGQVVSNLISNARHHGTAGGVIEVRIGDGGAPVLEVRNAGAPIPPIVADALFTPFKRSSAASEHNSSGLGIGLYIVAEILKEHAGSIAYRHDGEVVVFEVTVPDAG